VSAVACGTLYDIYTVLVNHYETTRPLDYLYGLPNPNVALVQDINSEAEKIVETVPKTGKNFHLMDSKNINYILYFDDLFL
jgi:hypothetical protein